MNTLTEPLAYDFFVRGLAVAGLVGGLCGMIGVFIVLRRMSYIGHGLSHSVFGGAVVAYLLGWNFYLGAGLWGFLSALLINATARRRDIGATPPSASSPPPPSPSTTPSSAAPAASGRTSRPPSSATSSA